MPSSKSITNYQERKGSTTRVVYLSKTHKHRESTEPLPDGDLLIHAGDLTQSGTLAELGRVVTWLSGQPHTYKVFIVGNHDAALTNPEVVEHERKVYSGLVYLQENEISVTIRGRVLSIYGSPYTPRHGSWQFQYPRTRHSHVELSTQWITIPLKADILVTHGPPVFHLDNNGSCCPGLLRALWKVRPRLDVFGHIHAAHRLERVSWRTHQQVYERICLEQAGWWSLLVLLSIAISKCIVIRGGNTTGAGTILVNASVVGRQRDELRWGAIVVDI